MDSFDIYCLELWYCLYYLYQFFTVFTFY